MPPTNQLRRPIKRGSTKPFVASGKHQALLPVMGEGRRFPGKVSQVSLTLPQTLSFEQWKGIGATLHSIERGVMWWISDWLSFGERKFGEMYREAIEQTGYQYGTLANARYVGERFPPSYRYENL